MVKPIKGGSWTNVEDEVLKAAIMKYGTNQWARVASLINRKSAQQCKARWYEYLSPTVKKTEWTQEENENLLHMAKIFPTQWRTIADSIGRTPTQCHIQYATLTEKNYQIGESSEVKVEVNLDIRPENRPAKPDPKDMAEDQKDMLSEARARLANTQGKKAKRKGRERQLALARRLSTVQQKRELAEVGINSRQIHLKKKPGINYNDEIPFYQPIPKGFHDTTKEKLEIEEKVIGKRVSELEFETREDREKNERKKDSEIKRKREEDNLPAVIKQTTNSVIKRSKLDLPEPKIDDEEFQNLWKMGKDRNKLLETELSKGSESTNFLLTQHLKERNESANITATPTPLITNNRIAMEAENLRAMSMSSNPLLGGDNPELYDIKAIEASNRVVETPNTSLRSNLLGTPQIENAYNTPSIRGSAKDGFRYSQKNRPFEDDLPAPKPVKIEMDISNDHGAQLDLDKTNVNSTRVEDQENVERRRAEQHRAEEAAQWKRRSQVAQRELPRPTEINDTILRPEPQVGDTPLTDIQHADEMIKREMLLMMCYDAVHNPVPVDANGRYRLKSRGDRRKLLDEIKNTNIENFKKLNSANKAADLDHYLNELNETDLDKARQLINEEMLTVKQEMHPNIDINLDTYSKVWDECYNQVLYLPTERRFSRANLITKKDRLECLRYEFDTLNAQYNDMQKSLKKKEDKQTILLNGYMSRAKLLSDAIVSVYDQAEKFQIELNSLQKMQLQEREAIKRRLSSLEEDVARQEQRENQLQARYAELKKINDQSKAQNTQAATA